jgi:hypothetical protein
MLYEDAIDAISASTILKIGSLGEDGIILWHTNAGSIIPFPVGGVYVQLETLAAADATLSFLLGNGPQTTVDAGASTDLAGLSTIISDPLGGGAVIDRGATATLTLGAANFLGHDLGPLSRPRPLGFRHRAAGRVRSCCLRF